MALGVSVRSPLAVLVGPLVVSQCDSQRATRRLDRPGQHYLETSLIERTGGPKLQDKGGGDTRNTSTDCQVWPSGAGAGGNPGHHGRGMVGHT